MDPGTIFGGISAASSIIGGIFGASQADKANKAQEKNYKKQQKAAKEAAKLQNEYNAKKFAADKKNFEAQQQYNYETALERYRYDTSIRAYQEKQDMRKYQRDVQQTQAQIQANNYAYEQGTASAQLGLNEARTEQSFERQAMLVENLIKQGSVSLRQAGTSQGKAAAATLAEMGRDIAVMDASMKSKVDQTNRDLLSLGYQRTTANQNAQLNAMLRPESLPAIPKPVRPPDPVWVEPLKVLPQTVSAPVPQNVFAPLMAGIGAAASTLSAMDWNPRQTAQQQQTGGSAATIGRGIMGTL